MANIKPADEPVVLSDAEQLAKDRAEFEAERDTWNAQRDESTLAALAAEGDGTTDMDSACGFCHETHPNPEGLFTCPRCGATEAQGFVKV